MNHGTLNLSYYFLKTISNFTCIFYAQIPFVHGNVKEKRPQSVYELAKFVNRDLKNVTQDLGFLERLGLVGLKKTKDKRAKTTPSVEYDKILLEIAV